MLEAGSVSYGKATAYVPVLDLLKVYFQIEGRDDTRKTREKVMGKLLSLDRALEPSLPALLSLLDVPVEDAAWERLDPLQRRQQTLDGVKRLLLRESQVQPLLVLFEDLHDDPHISVSQEGPSLAWAMALTVLLHWSPGESRPGRALAGSLDVRSRGGGEWGFAARQPALTEPRRRA